jgi:hypothetical protein
MAVERCEDFIGHGLEVGNHIAHPLGHYPEQNLYGIQTNEKRPGKPGRSLLVQRLQIN